ncbi:MAG: ligand-binding sensor domain-containing protein [Cyclobacteriaceae bacterium]|jgi:ligand-binding sensor domain-containing protein
MTGYSLHKLMLFILLGILAKSLIATDLTIDYYARFHRIGLKEGLPDKQVTVIVEDDRGFMWIGTRNGLVRFDGQNFITFRNGLDSCSLSNNYIMDLAFDPSGILWIATHQGLNRFDPANECFEKIPLITESGRGISNPYVRALLPEKDFLWVETLDGILQQMDYNVETTQLYPHQRIHQAYYDYHTLYRDSEGTLWVGGRGIGPMYLDPKSNTLRTIENAPEDPTKKRDKDVAFYFEDSQGNFWTGATDGAYIYDKVKNQFKKVLATSTYDMVEDDHQNLWLATGSGLYRYNLDHQLFTKYAHFESDSYSLSDNHIKCVFKDQQGRIWAGTQNGISIWSENNNTIRHFRHLPYHKQSLSDDHVTTFLEDQNNSLWIGTMGGGLNLKTNSSEQFERWTKENSDLLSNRISALHESPNGTIWIGHWIGRGFQRLHPEKHTFENFAVLQNSRKIDWYNDFEDFNDSLLVTGIWGGRGLYLFDKHKNEFLPNTWKKLYHPVDAPIKKMVFDGKNLWLDSHINLVYQFNLESHTYTGYQSNAYTYDRSHFKLAAAELPTQFNIHEMYTAKETVFLLTDQGVYYRKQQDPDFKFLSQKVFQSITYLPDTNEIWLGSKEGLFRLTEDWQLEHIVNGPNEEGIFNLTNVDNNRLLATTNDLLWTFDRASFKWTQNETRASFNGQVKKIDKIVAMDQTNLIITHPQGFSYYDGTTDSVTYYDFSTAFHQGLSSNVIYDAIKPNQSQMVWLATDQGIFSFNSMDGTFEKLPYLNGITVYQIIALEDNYFLASEKGLYEIDRHGEINAYNLVPDDMITSHLTSFTVKDQRGASLWTGTTNKGVNKIDIENQTVEHFTKDHGFYGTSALAFCQLSNGEIYVGGEVLNHFNNAASRFDIPEFASLIPKESILGLSEDINGDLWVVTQHHILKINLTTSEVSNLTPAFETDNLSFTGGIFSSREGLLNIGSDRGYFQLDPMTVFTKAPKTQIQVTTFQTTGNDQMLQIRNGDQIELDPQENFFNIQFSTMDVEEKNTHYTYMLTGVDKDWVTTTSNTVTYTKISHGNYSFLVKRENEAYADAFGFHLKIKPPVWASWWFISSFVLFNLALIAYWWNLQLSRIRISEKNLNLRQRLLLSQMNPHFIFNMLTTIQGFIYKKQPEIAGDHLSKFARLMRLYLSNMSQEYVSLEKEEDTLRYYLELQRVRNNEQFDYAVNISCDEPIELIGLPSMILQPFVENAVIHGISNLDYKGRISCAIRLTENHWEIVIEDNGKGFKLSDIGPDKKSHSVTITLGRLEMLSKQYKKKFTLQVTNLSEQAEKATGTRISLTLPVVEIQN